MSQHSKVALGSAEILQMAEAEYPITVIDDIKRLSFWFERTDTKEMLGYIRIGNIRKLNEDARKALMDIMRSDTMYEGTRWTRLKSMR